MYADEKTVAYGLSLFRYLALFVVLPTVILAAIISALVMHAHSLGLESTMELVPRWMPVFMALFSTAAVVLLIHSSVMLKRYVEGDCHVLRGMTTLAWGLVFLWGFMCVMLEGSDYALDAKVHWFHVPIPASSFHERDDRGEDVLVKDCGVPLRQFDGEKNRQWPFLRAANGGGLTTLGRSGAPSYRYLVRVDHPESFCMDSEYLVSSHSLAVVARLVDIAVDGAQAVQRELAAVHPLAGGRGSN